MESCLARYFFLGVSAFFTVKVGITFLDEYRIKQDVNKKICKSHISQCNIDYPHYQVHHSDEFPEIQRVLNYSRVTLLKGRQWCLLRAVEGALNHLGEKKQNIYKVKIKFSETLNSTSRKFGSNGKIEGVGYLMHILTMSIGICTAPFFRTVYVLNYFNDIKKFTPDDSEAYVLIEGVEYLNEFQFTKLLYLCELLSNKKLKFVLLARVDDENKQEFKTKRLFFEVPQLKIKKDDC